MHHSVCLVFCLRVNEIIQYVFFHVLCFGFAFLSSVPLRFSCAVAGCGHSFSLLYSTPCVNRGQSTSSSHCWRIFDCFQVGAAMSNAAMNIPVHIIQCT